MADPQVHLDFMELPIGKRPFFEVNSAVPQVILQPPAVVGPLIGPGALSVFAAGDSVLIGAGGSRFPYSFIPGTESIEVTLYWKTLTNVYPIGSFRLPISDSEISFAGSNTAGFFAQHPGIKLEPGVSAQIFCNLTTFIPQVSMVYVPTAFPDATVLEVPIFFKIQHLFALAAP